MLMGSKSRHSDGYSEDLNRRIVEDFDMEVTHAPSLSYPYT